MNPTGSVSLSPLRTDRSPVWLTRWLRDDFDYALTEPILDVSPNGDAETRHAAALVELAEGLAGPSSRWFLATPREDGVDLVASTAIDVVEVRAGLHAALACPAAGPPPATAESALRACTAVLIGRDGWSDAVVGAHDLPGAVDRLGAHLQPDPVEAYTLGALRPDRSASLRRRRVALAAAGAAVVAAATVFAFTRTSNDPHVTSPATPGVAATDAPGLLLPTGTRFPGGRSGAGASFDPLTGTVTLFGGGRLGGTSADDLLPRDTWSWGNNGWRRLSTAVAPPGVSYPAFAYDEATASALLFGGIDATGATWQWNGVSWRQLHPRQHPPTGVFAAAAYDPRQRAVVLTTVCCQSARAGTAATVQSWVWRDGNWLLLPARGAPASSRAPLIAYDIARGELLLFTQGPTPATDDTDQITASSALWALDGAQWRRVRTPRSPPYDPIRDRLAYDPASRRVVLFQGGDLPTWTWDGTAWHRQAGAGGPLYSGAMTTDATVGNVLLFGGQVPSEDLAQVWTLERGRWKRLSGR